MDNLRLILIFASEIAFLAAFAHWKKLEKAQRLFGLFLLLGFLHDLKIFFVAEDDPLSDQMLAVYVLLEIAFYGWFIFHLSPKAFPKTMRQVFYWAIFPFWALCFFVLEDPEDNDFFNGMYDGVTAAFISCIAAWALIKMSEKRIKLEASPTFWFLGGAFMYFFCSVFIFSILSREVSQGAWIVHNVINLLAMLMYAVGFVLAGRTKKNRD